MKYAYTYSEEVYNLLENNNPKSIRELFAIYDDTPVEEVYSLCYLFIHYYFPEFFKKEECDEQIQILKNNCDLELGLIKTLTEAGFRGLGKTTTSKLVQVFFLANNQRTDRGRYYKVISKDDTNAVQVVTDLYNMLVQPNVLFIYSHLWQKSDLKRKETQSEFDLSTGVKVRASTVQRGQRGNIQQASRPDRIWFEDIEDAKSLRSAVETVAIWATMDEAYQGLSAEGRALYNVNYVSKRGNVHKIVLRGLADPERHRVHIVPIYNRKTKKPTWYHTLEQIEAIRREAENFEGDYMCNPANSEDAYFSEDFINMHPTRQPIATENGWSFYAKRDPKHTYVMGVDPAGGGGGDFAVITVIDLTVGELVAHYYSKFANEIALAKMAHKYGILYNEALLGVERNNHGSGVIVQLINLEYPNLHMETKIDKWSDKETPNIGFWTDSRSKPMILSDLSKALNNFALRVPSAIIKEELVNFPREYADRSIVDPELGHFDGVMSLAIAWHMRLFVGLVSELSEEGVSNNNVIIN